MGILRRWHTRLWIWYDDQRGRAWFADSPLRLWR
jgi:hypothetical protein